MFITIRLVPIGVSNSLHISSPEARCSKPNLNKAPITAWEAHATAAGDETVPLTQPYGCDETPLLSGFWSRDVLLRFLLTLANFVFHHTLGRLAHPCGVTQLKSSSTLRDVNALPPANV